MSTRPELQHDTNEADNSPRVGDRDFQAVFEAAGIGTALTDLHGVLLDTNPSLQRLLGYSAGELRGLGYPAFTHPDDAAVQGELFQELLAGERDHYRLEKRYIRKDGTIVWGRLTESLIRDAGGTPLYAIALVGDITERVRVEDERRALVVTLETERARLEMMLQQLPAGIVIAEAPSGRIIMSNELAERMVGRAMAATSLEGYGAWTAFHRDGRLVEPVEWPLARAVNSGEIIQGDVYEFARDDGTTGIVRVSAGPIRDPEGRIVAGLAVFSDITEEERAVRAQRFLSEASIALSTSLDYQTTLRTVAELAVPHIADWCVVDTVTDSGEIRRLAAAHVDPAKEALAREVNERYPEAGDDTTGIARVLAARTSILVPEISEAQLDAGARDEVHLQILRELGLRSAMVVPIVARDNPLGAITFIAAESGRRYGPQDLALAEDLARRAAVAIDNAHLYAAEQKARKEAEVAVGRTAHLQAVAEGLSEALTPLDVARVVTTGAAAAFGAAGGSLVTLDDAGEHLETLWAIGYEPEQLERFTRFPVDAPYPLSRAVKLRRPEWLASRDEIREHYPDFAGNAVDADTQALIAIPLVLEGQSIGALGLSLTHPHPLTADDRELMVALSRQCAQALERARLYQAERDARAEAQAALRAREEFLSVASHELKTPLTALQLQVQVLQRVARRATPTSEARVQSTIVAAERQVKRLTRLVEELLDVSRLDAGKLVLERAPADLVSIVRDAVGRFVEEAAVGGTTITVREPGPVCGEWDAFRLDQVITNLVSNALKYGAGRPVDITVADAGEWAEVTVADQGIGIDPNDAERIFDRFERIASPQQYGGLGLGLHIAREIVRVHGGEITVDSRSGMGATFVVRLPKTAEGSQE